MAADTPLVGFICPPDHEMFEPVAARLRDRGFDVDFLEVGVEIPTERLDALDLLVNKKVRWESLDALEYAHRHGVPTWNGYVTTMLFLNRLSQVATLSAAGFPVPEIRTDPPDGDYVAKGFLDIDQEPTLNGDGDFYQPLLQFDGTDQKYYAVDDGERVRTAVVEFDSKLFGKRTHRGHGTVSPSVQRRLRRLLDFTNARAVGVDVVEVDGTAHAVDANPATSFKRTGLEGALVDSIAAAM